MSDQFAASRVAWTAVLIVVVLNPIYVSAVWFVAWCVAFESLFGHTNPNGIKIRLDSMAQAGGNPKQTGKGTAQPTANQYMHIVDMNSSELPAALVSNLPTDTKAPAATASAVTSAALIVPTSGVVLPPGVPSVASTGAGAAIGVSTPIVPTSSSAANAALNQLLSVRDMTALPPSVIDANTYSTLGGAAAAAAMRTVPTFPPRSATANQALTGASGAPHAVVSSSEAAAAAILAAADASLARAAALTAAGGQPPALSGADANVQSRVEMTRIGHTLSDIDVQLQALERTAAALTGEFGLGRAVLSAAEEQQSKSQAALLKSKHAFLEQRERMAARQNAQHKQRADQLLAEMERVLENSAEDEDSASTIGAGGGGGGGGGGQRTGGQNRPPLPPPPISVVTPTTSFELQRVTSGGTPITTRSVSGVGSAPSTPGGVTSPLGSARSSAGSSRPPTAGSVVAGRKPTGGGGAATAAVKPKPKPKPTKPQSAAEKQRELLAQRVASKLEATTKQLQQFTVKFDQTLAAAAAASVKSKPTAPARVQASTPAPPVTAAPSAAASVVPPPAPAPAPAPPAASTGPVAPPTPAPAASQVVPVPVPTPKSTSTSESTAPPVVTQPSAIAATAALPPPNQRYG